MPPPSPPEPTDDQPQSPHPDATTSGPFRAEWDVSHLDDATLVTVRVTNTAPHSRVVHLENRLDGPVLPPRRNGVSEGGWDADGVTRSVPPEATIAVGYACHAPPRDPPVTVCDSPADEPTETSVERALRSLGEHAPPRAAVAPRPPMADPDSTSDSNDAGDVASTDAAESTRDEPGSRPEETDTDADSIDVAAEGSDAGRNRRLSPADPSTQTPPNACDSTVPQTVDSWFDAVEARLHTVDRLDASVEAATPVLASIGGRRGVETLAETLAADARALRAAADRAEALAARVDACSIPDLGEEP